MLRNSILGLLLGICLVCMAFLSGCESELPVIHIYDEGGNDLMDGDGETESCVTCHADEEYLREDLETNPPEEPPASGETEGEG